MATLLSSPGVGPDPQLKDSEERVLRAREDAEESRRRCAVSQTASVESLGRSAESHDRIAVSYEGMAKRMPDEEEWGDHAAAHRRFAWQDREMSERMRRMTETGEAP